MAMRTPYHDDDPFYGTETMDISLPSRDELKALAKRLRAAMQDAGTPMTHTAALEAIAKQWGFRDWNTLSAKATDAPQLRWQIGQAVTGHYLGHAFTGKVKAAKLASAGFWHLTLVFDTPVDVVASAHFSNFRRQVNCVVNSQGISLQATSDGQPHVVLRPNAM